MRLFKLLTASAIMASVSVLPARAADPIDPAKFAHLHALIKPKAAEETWAQIPWMTSLWEARRQAAREGKPILLWEMDGHPLGCV